MGVTATLDSASEAGIVRAPVRSFEGDAVALGRLDGQFQAEFRGNGGRPGAAGEYDFIRTEFAPRGDDRLDPAVPALEADDFGGWVNLETCTVFVDVTREFPYESCGNKVGVLRIVHGARGVVVGHRIQSSQAVLVEYFRPDSLCGQNAGFFDASVQPLFGLIDHQAAFFLETEIQAIDGGDFREKLHARQVEIPQDRQGWLHARRGTGCLKIPQPFREFQVQTGLDVEWAFRIEHPLERFADNAGGGEGNAVAGDNQARVAVRTARADIGFVDEDNVLSRF